MATFSISGYQAASDTLADKQLSQSMYDEGAVIMADVLLVLHGAPHRARRGLELRVFRRDFLRYYEHEVFPATLAQTMAAHARRGHADLIDLGYGITMNLTADFAGVDRPRGDAEETALLRRLTAIFSEGATLVHSTRNNDEVRAEVRAALVEFESTFYCPSMLRRRGLLARFATGEIPEEVLPRDVLTVLLRNVDQLALPDDMILRETAFFLLSGAHTTATSFTRTMHRLLDHLDTNPGDRARACDDRRFLQQVVHEVLRLEPPSPVRRRRALVETTVGDGMAVPAGTIVDLDLVAANRDRDVFGTAADAFIPGRRLPADVAPWGTSFGTGMHACIGLDMAAGTLPDGDANAGGPADMARLFGLVPVAVQAVLQMGIRRDPDDPPELDAMTSRGYFSRYPVLFSARH